MQSIPQHILKRKGARRVGDVPIGILQLLNMGAIESVNLMESLAMDLDVLFFTIFPEFPMIHYEEIKASKKKWLGKTYMIAEKIYETYGVSKLTMLGAHTSDNVRGWAALIIARHDAYDLSKKFEFLTPLANDHHFGVREVAWLAFRGLCLRYFQAMKPFLHTWVQSDQANLRRFAIELTRPRGVWCAYFHDMQKNPELMAELLAFVMNDEVKYVRDSAANWLNDAAKTQPDWVLQFLKNYEQKHGSEIGFQYIKRRATRNLK